MALNERTHFQKVNKSWGAFIMKLHSKVLEKTKIRYFKILKPLLSLTFYFISRGYGFLSTGNEDPIFFLYNCSLALYMNDEHK